MSTNRGFLILGVLLITALAVAVRNKGDKDLAAEKKVTSTIAVTASYGATGKPSNQDLDYADGIYQIGRLTGGTYNAKTRLTKEDILQEIEAFNSAARSISTVTTKADSTKKLFKKVASELAKLQVKDFPTLRRNYAGYAANKLWEENVTVTCSGQGNTTINITGGLFADNKNIKLVQETIGYMFRDLRFKKVAYRWYEGQTNYTYYQPASKRDSDITGD
jgi:hypothetical protein